MFSMDNGLVLVVKTKKKALFSKGFFQVGFKFGPDNTQVAFCRFSARFGKLTLHFRLSS
jgi:hypothetical protein